MNEPRLNTHKHGFNPDAANKPSCALFASLPPAPQSARHQAPLLRHPNECWFSVENRSRRAGRKKPPVRTTGGLKLKPNQNLVGVGDGALTGNTGSREGIALGKDGGVGLVSHGLNNLDVLGRVGAHEVRGVNGGVTGLEVILVGSRRELTQVIRDGFVLGVRANLLERGNRHSGQEADDDNYDHDFNKRKALVVKIFHIYCIIFM